MSADLRKILTFEPHGRCHRATHNGRSFLLLAEPRSGSFSLFEQIPLDEPASDAVDPGALEARPVARPRRRRPIADDRERRLHGTLRGLGLVTFDDDILPAERGDRDEL